MTTPPRPALVIIDVQEGFDDLAAWGPTTNPGCEANIALLAAHWQERDWPIVVVRHDSSSPSSPLHPGNPGNRLQAGVAQVNASLTVVKSVNSAFIGHPDLHAWLAGQGLDDLVIVGIQTNMCVETTARMGGNLGYRVRVPLDATRTFDLSATDARGRTDTIPAAELMRVTAVNLQGGGFAQVTDTQTVLVGA